MFLAEKCQRSPNKPREVSQHCQARGAPVLAAASLRQNFLPPRESFREIHKKRRSNAALSPEVWFATNRPRSTRSGCFRNFGVPVEGEVHPEAT